MYRVDAALLTMIVSGVGGTQGINLDTRRRTTKRGPLFKSSFRCLRIQWPECRVKEAFLDAIWLWRVLPTSCLVWGQDDTWSRITHLTEIRLYFHILVVLATLTLYSRRIYDTLKQHVQFFQIKFHYKKSHLLLETSKLIKFLQKVGIDHCPNIKIFGNNVILFINWSVRARKSANFILNTRVTKYLIFLSI